MNKWWYTRELVFIIVVIGLFAFSVLAANPITVQPAQQQSVVGAPHTQLTPAAEPQGNPDLKVWVNTNYGVYHCPGTRWYLPSEVALPRGSLKPTALRSG
jgi:hypothetical protein